MSKASNNVDGNMDNKKTQLDKLSLTELMNQLDQIVAWFNSGEVDIDEATVKFDEGVKLAEYIKAKLAETASTLQSADDFIRNIKKYFEAPTLTREMCYELIERVIVGGVPKITGKEREIHIVYKVDIASVLRYKFGK